MNILVTLSDGAYPFIIDNETQEKLESLGTVSYRPELDKKSTEQEYADALKEAQAEITVTGWGSPRLTMEVYKENPQLKYMCHLAGTVRAYIEPEVIDEGVLVSNWGTVIARSVAEGALMMILGTLRKITYYEIELHMRKGWHGDDRESEGLFHQRVGLHGLGAIAQELVKLLKPFDCAISAYSPHCPDEVFEKCGVSRADTLEDLFSSNRIISIHASKTDDNFHIINKDILALLEDGGILVNTARGAVIDTEALIAECKTGRIEAALDVFEEEPLPVDSALRGLENCMLVPHMGGPTPDRRVDMGCLGVSNIENFINGNEVIHIVTREKYNLIT
ncbi:hydroxyacid dehydrogenase [Planctomycetota bacterium]